MGSQLPERSIGEKATVSLLNRGAGSLSIFMAALFFFFVGTFQGTGLLQAAEEGDSAEMELEKVIQELQEEEGFSRGDVEAAVQMAREEVFQQYRGEFEGVRGTSELAAPADLVTPEVAALTVPEEGGNYRADPLPEMTDAEQELAGRVETRYQDLRDRGFSDKEIDEKLKVEFEREFSAFKDKEHRSMEMDMERGRDMSQPEMRERSRSEEGQRDLPEMNRETVEVRESYREMERTEPKPPQEQEEEDTR